jgi:DNA-binding transcriptional LysR family regulator
MPKRIRPIALARPDLSLDDLGALSMFAQVVDAGSFTAAARRNGTTTSAVSKRIAGLERRLGVRLLERSTRHVAPTQAGIVLYEHCQRLIAEAHAAEEAVTAQRSELRGTIRVSAPVTFGQMHIAQLVREFLEQHAQLRVVLTLTDRKVDLIAEGVDVVVRAGRADDSSLIARALAPDRRVVCATPRYFKRHGTPRAPKDLLQHACLKHPLMGSPQGWNFETSSGALTVPVSGPLEIDNIAALRDAALADFGLALIPEYAVAAELASGALLSVLDAYVPASPPFRALWVARDHRPARVIALIEWLANKLPARLGNAPM